MIIMMDMSIDYTFLTVNPQKQNDPSYTYS